MVLDHSYVLQVGIFIQLFVVSRIAQKVASGLG